MLVVVARKFRDLQADSAVREVGQLLDYESEDRAKELLAKGFVRRAEITEVKEPEKKQAAKK